ncbi:hypothetical protein GCM10010919_01040 [Alishewanella longhuensis]|uniref:Serine aminopeptidase S33 domain-containing protein n=1 Tax=Alishewanella longhuensis TaxID=1091037 RepID=A0ABQ3KTB8_9ALTE|nr:alpha/beta fold hydrolase [Alishewanella longhuensis]GHG58943.1 hypothetical protein GCM10010919_01040 [Alishewanella longhuensis]
MLKKLLLILILIVFIMLLILASTMAKANSYPLDIVQQNFKAQSDGLALDGYILRNRHITKPQPIIVFVVGSGVGSTMANYKRTTEFFFDNQLLEQGFAIAYFDKRGLGASEGVWYTTTFEQRALDARNVALHIRDYDFVDPERIFIVGHSQGGWIVQIALAEYPEIFAGGISMAGPTFSVRKQMINDAASKIACEDGLDEIAAFKKASRKVQRDLFFISLVGWKGNLRQLNLIKDFDPESYLKSINKPLLMLFGENDPLVSVRLSLEALDRIFSGNLPQNFEYFIGAGEEHSFKIAPKCFQGKWSELAFSESTRQKISEWLNVQASINLKH